MSDLRIPTGSPNVVALDAVVEAVARIIDPDSWSQWQENFDRRSRAGDTATEATEYADMLDERASSTRKAQAILDALSRMVSDVSAVGLAREVYPTNGSAIATDHRDSSIEVLAEAIDLAILHEREACAFAAETHSGFGDPTTIETIAEIIRDRGPRPLGRDPVHTSQENYERLKAIESSVEPTIPGSDEDLAILLCRSAGHDPDVMTYHSEDGIQEPYGPAWSRYLDQARSLRAFMSDGREEMECDVWRVGVNDDGKIMNLYTEALPFLPLRDSKVRVRREPEALYPATATGFRRALDAERKAVILRLHRHLDDDGETVDMSTVVRGLRNDLNWLESRLSASGTER